jgi:hypothetical protein
VLLHFTQFADKLGVFNAQLERLPEDEAERLRRQLPSNIFVQLLAGPIEIRTGSKGFLLWLTAHVTLVIAPLALLILLLLKFLPFHSEIAWWQRLAFLADIVLLWILWPSVARGKATLIAWPGVVRSAKFAGLTLARLWQARSPLARDGALQRARADMRRAKVFALALLSVILVSQVFVVATYPGELLHRLPRLPFIPWPDAAGGFSVRLASLHELLFAEGANLAERRPQGLLSNRIVLPGLNVIDRTKFDSEAKIAALPESVSLRARHLEGAVLIGATLFNADFTAADMTGAKLDEADLRGARFDCAEREQGGKVTDLRLCDEPAHQDERDSADRPVDEENPVP